MVLCYVLCYNQNYVKEAVKFFIEKDLNGIKSNLAMFIDSRIELYYVLKDIQGKKVDIKSYYLI
ncbi:hypothetical protein ACTPEW_04840 [Clostridioides difficile]